MYYAITKLFFHRQNDSKIACGSVFLLDGIKENLSMKNWILLTDCQKGVNLIIAEYGQLGWIFYKHPRMFVESTRGCCRIQHWRLLTIRKG